MKHFISVLALAAVLGLSACKEEVKDIVVWIPGDEVEYGFYFDALADYQAAMEAEGKEFRYVIEQQPWSDYWVKLPLEVNNGRGPDLFLTHWAYDTNLRGISKELALTEAEKGAFRSTDLYPGKGGGPVYIPTTFVSKVMFVNRDLAPDFDTAAAATWEGFVAELTKLKGTLPEGVIPFQYSFHMLYDLRYAAGKTFTDAQGGPALDDTGLDFLKGLDDAGLCEFIKRQDPDPEMNNATAAVVYGEPWMEFWASDNVKDAIEAFPVPGPVTHKGLELSFGINKNVKEERFAELNGFVKFMLTDEKANSAIVKGSSGTPNLKGLEVSYRAGTAGSANVASDHAVLFIPPQPFEDAVKNMLGNWEGLGGAKDTETVIKEANQAFEKIDLHAISEMEARFRDSL